MSAFGDPAVRTKTVRCCIAGGGPAGMMLGLLLARAGVEVAVLEKHGDFLRDFRGDTVHPSTLEIMHELGFLDEFLTLPHQKATTVTGQVGETSITLADFSRLPTVCRFIAFMPQWDFLTFLADKAKAFPGFRLRMRTEVTGLIEEGGRIVGVRALTPEGPIEVRADLTVAADGRHSDVRDLAGLAVEDLGAPMDVLWMRLSRRPDDPDQPFGRFDPGQLFVMLNRGDYFQCALVIPKGSFEAVRRQGLDRLRERIATAVPFLRDRIGELRDWDDVKLLTVAVNRLTRWHRPGLLCIGDAAHAMSPVGGVGINLAIQDAVAAANILAAPLRDGRVAEDHLRSVQERREFPTRATQRLQVLVQNRIIGGTLRSTGPVSIPWPLRWLLSWPPIRRIPARIMGLGLRPEHVESPILAGPRCETVGS
jgi:2-polyprenyl-6-methoxyphenol hydroxylase-like FAD-dependent oxidoreductase